jgi:hypothetical protein
MEALRMAFGVFEGMDGRRFDRIRDALEHGIHARELERAGREDEEARRVMRLQPGDENLLQILAYAERLCRVRKQDERADHIHRARETWNRPSERPRERPHRDRRWHEAMHALEIAHESLERERLKEMLRNRMEQLRANREWTLEQTGQVLEILAHAEERLRRAERGDAADLVHRYREGLHTHWKRARENAERRRPDREMAERVERLERRMERMAQLLERVVDELEDRAEDEDDDDRDDDEEEEDRDR